MDIGDDKFKLNGKEHYAELVFKPLLFCFPLFICFPFSITDFTQVLIGVSLIETKKYGIALVEKLRKKPSIFSCVCSSLYDFCV